MRLLHLSMNPLSALVVLLGLGLVSANSEPARPLKRLAHPSTIALEILPRIPASNDDQPRSSASIFSPETWLDKLRGPDHSTARSTILHHDDSFRLIISAFGQTFHLHLRPNDHLIHPEATVHHYTTSPDGKSSRITESKPLLRHSIKAYEGSVIRPAESISCLREDSASSDRHVRPATHPSVLGWARIVVHDQGDIVLGRAPIFEGAFSVNGNIHHIMTTANYLRSRQPLDGEIDDAVDPAVDSELIVWRDSDVMSKEEVEAASKVLESGKPMSCGHDRLTWNTDWKQNPMVLNPFLRPLGANLSIVDYDKRDDVDGNGMNTNFADSIGLTVGCPTDQRILYMGVAADCKYVQQYGSRDNATKQILSDWNSASSLYKSTFNISLGIIELQIQDPTCPSSPLPSAPWNLPCSTTLNDRLSIFSDWRGNKGSDNVGLWHLMSGCPTGTEVGIAWLATLCQQSSSGKAPSIVSGTAVSTSGRTEWQVIAHEIGHNFGAIHDCAEGCNANSPCCPLTAGGTCDAGSAHIMSPVAQPGEKTFSPCSVGNICSVMGGTRSSTTNSTCLASPEDALKTISLQMCGNGIVEKGEDCDPGSGVDSDCCDSNTCKFKNNAVCDPLSSPCCTDRCSFAPATQVCRPSRDAKCDTAEKCTGTSSSCPADVVSPNGQSCGDNSLACASGVCTSVSKQCSTVGASMGLRQACPNRGDNTCQISCQDPTRGNQCVLLSSMLIDGSPCGYGGLCASGKCRAGSALDTAKAWYTQNLQISIPVTVVAGLFAIAIIWGIIRSCCCRRRKAHVPTPTLSALRHERLGSYDRGAGPMPSFRSGNGGVTQPHHAHHHSRSRSANNWVDDQNYNGARGAGGGVNGGRY